MTQNVRAGKGKCTVRQTTFGEVPREEGTTVADRKRGGDHALSAVGHGAEPHTRQGKHAPPYLRTYGGWQPATSAMLAPIEKGRRSFSRYILRPCCLNLGASTLHILFEKNWRSSIGHNAHPRQLNGHGQFGCCD
jgi:hypothetical protein